MQIAALVDAHCLPAFCRLLQSDVHDVRMQMVALEVRVQSIVWLCILFLCNRSVTSLLHH